MIDRTLLTPKLITQLRENSHPEAPWAAAPKSFWTFLEDSADIKWGVDTFLVNRWVLPKTPRTPNQEMAHLRKLSSEERGGTPSNFLFGIGVVEDKHITTVYYRGGKPESKLPKKRNTPSAENFTSEALRSLTQNFWPDIPYLVFEKVRPLVSSSDLEKTSDYDSTANFSHVQRLDAGKMFRVLTKAERLNPVHKEIINWNEVISEPGKHETATKKRAPKP